MGNIAKRRRKGGANPTMAMDEMPAALKERRRLEKLQKQLKKNWKDAPPPPKKEGKGLRVTEAILQRARNSIKRDIPNPFKFPSFPASCTPPKSSGMAMDDVFGDTSNNDFSWASQAFLAGIGAAYQEGLVFPGYTYLAELAQRPEYRVISEIIAEEMTRKWIKITSKSDDEDKTDKIRELTDAMDKLKIREAFQKIAETDGFFGRAHLYIDIRPETEDKGSDTTVIDRDELKTPIGNGRDDITKSKVPTGSFKRVKVVEPVWTYPTNYNASDPLSTEWYMPDMWYVMGKQIHASRLLRFVGREVPDILKPAYAFGGLSMSQMAKPYVDNWLKTRQSVADIISAFSVFVLSTDMGEVLMDQSDDLFKRVDLFNLLRNNKGAMVINKDSEEFQNVSAPLGTLDSLQAQTQEHMASVGRIPIVKLLGIQPAGLNASSEGEIRTFYDHIHAYQEKFYKPNLEVVFNLAQMSLWGEVDDDLVFSFIELWELDAAALSTKNKTDADAGIALVQAGIISVEEERKRIANDPDTPYQSLDIQDIPEPPQQEGMPGMEGMEDGSEAGNEEGDPGPAEGTPGGELGQRGGPDRGGGGGSAVRQGSPDAEGTDDLEGGGPSDSGPEDGGMEETGIKQSQRNKLTAAAALARNERRKRLAGDSDFKEADHPRGQPENSGQFAKTEGKAKSESGGTPQNPFKSGPGANELAAKYWNWGREDALAGKPFTESFRNKIKDSYQKGYESAGKTGESSTPPPAPEKVSNVDSEAAKKSLYSFASETDSEIQYALRGVNQMTEERDNKWSKSILEANKDALAGIDSLMSKSDIGSKRLYRGMSEDFFGGSKPSVGMTFKDQAFVFTTTDKSVADKFSDPDRGYLLRISTRKGDRGIDLNAEGLIHDSKNWEQAVLLDRGTKFRIKSISGRNIDVEVVGQR